MKAGAWAVEVDHIPGVAATVAARELTGAIEQSGGTLGRAKAAQSIRLTLGAETLPAESYCITSETRDGLLHITCVGKDARGLIYAAYDLAERIRHGEPLEGLAVEEKPYCTVRRIYTLWSDHEALARLIQAMPHWRLNALCLYGACHVPAHRPDLPITPHEHYASLPISYRNYPQVHEAIQASSYYHRTRESLTRLLRLAREYETDVFVHFGILLFVPMDDAGPHYWTLSGSEHLKHFPELFLEEKQIPDWDSPVVWAYVRDQLEELFDTYPDLAGINVHTDEMANFNLGHVASHGAPEQRRRWIRRMVEEVEETSAKYEKRCYWNLHGCGDLYIDTLVEIARSRPGGLRLCAECSRIDLVRSDRFPSYPLEKLAAAGDSMCDYDVLNQYVQAFPWLPNIVDRYILRHVRAQIEAGLRGGGAQWWEDGPYYSPLNSLSAVNMELLSRLLWNPEEPVDGIWERWLRWRFGEGAVATAGRLLRSTQEVMNGIFFFNNTNAYAWFDDGFLPHLDGLLGEPNGWVQMVEYFQPPGTPLYANPWNAVCRERALPIGQMRQEKQAAVRQAQELLDCLIQHKVDFADADYCHLLPRYVSLLYYARAAAQIVEALYNLTNLHIRAYDPGCTDPRRGLEQAIANLEAFYLEMLADHRLRHLEPDINVYGLRACFMDRIPFALRSLRFHDRVLSAPELLDTLAAEERDKARHILANAGHMREKFERNARGEVDAEQEWARALGDLNHGD